MVPLYIPWKHQVWATQAVALDISKAFDTVLHAGLLHKFKYYGISAQIFGFLSSFLSNKQFWGF